MDQEKRGYECCDQSREISVMRSSRQSRLCLKLNPKLESVIYYATEEVLSRHEHVIATPQLEEATGRKPESMSQTSGYEIGLEVCLASTRTRCGRTSNHSQASR
jgi:hypothetical protein